MSAIEYLTYVQINTCEGLWLYIVQPPTVTISFLVARFCFILCLGFSKGGGGGYLRGREWVEVVGSVCWCVGVDLANFSVIFGSSCSLVIRMSSNVY